MTGPDQAPPPASRTAPEVLLEAVFGDIAATRMRGLPILNPALQVETCAFQDWQGHRLGVLVTPWTISLALLDGGGLAGLPLGDVQAWDFPSGRYEFMGFQDARLGTCQLCPLISPVEDVASQDAARAVAAEIMKALFTTLPVTAPAAPGSARVTVADPAGTTAAAPPGAALRAPAASDVPPRRAFLRAVLPGA